MSYPSDPRTQDTWQAVQAMYESYPYPSPVVGESVISRLTERHQVGNLNLIDDSQLIDLDEVESTHLKHACQKAADRFPTEVLRNRFRQLDKAQRLRILEIKLKLTGFTAIAGHHSAKRRLSPRLRSNVGALT